MDKPFKFCHRCERRVRTVNGNFTVRNMLLESATCRLRREKLISEERCARFVVASPYCLSLITFCNAIFIIDWLGHVLTRNARARSSNCCHFCAHILYIVLATSTLIFRYGQGRSRAYTLQLDRHYYYYSALKYTHRLHIMIQAETHTITIRLAPTMFLTSV